MNRAETVYDRIVIGAGFAGLSAAYHLGLLGEKILVLEKGDGKEGASFASTAEMNHDPDADWEWVLATHGIEGARELWQLTEHAIVLLDAFAHRAGEEHFETKRVPAHMFSYRGIGTEKLQHKYDVYTKLGAHVSLASAPQVLHPAFTGVLTLEGDGRTNNQALLRTLSRAVRRQGGTILRNTGVDSVMFDGILPRVRTGKKEFVGKRVHIATGDQAIPGIRQLPIERHRTFVVKYRKSGMPSIFKNSVMWDVGEPFHYIRSFAGNDLWIGGEDMPEGDVTEAKEAAAFEKIHAFATDVLEVDATYTRHGAWSGTFFPTERSLPYIADDPELPISYSVGFGGSGLLMSFVSGYLHARWKKGNDMHLKRLFSLA